MTYQSPNTQQRGILKPVLERLIRRPLSIIPTRPSLIRTDWRVEKLRDFINTEHGKLGWNLEVLCKQLDLGVSGSHGARLFKKHTGFGIREYTKRQRLICAADKVRTTTLSIKEIAADLGYKTQTDLSRQFKTLFSLSPTEFRIAHRQSARQTVLENCPNPSLDPVREGKCGT